MLCKTKGNLQRLSWDHEINHQILTLDTNPKEISERGDKNGPVESFTLFLLNVMMLKTQWCVSNAFSEFLEATPKAQWQELYGWFLPQSTLLRLWDPSGSQAPWVEITLRKQKYSAEVVSCELLLSGGKKEEERKLSIYDQSDPGKSMLSGLETIPTEPAYLPVLAAHKSRIVTNSGCSGQAPGSTDTSSSTEPGSLRWPDRTSFINFTT